MTIGRLVALCGLFLAWWGSLADDGRMLAWAVVVVACSPIVRPLLGLDAGGPDAAPPARAPVPPREARSRTEGNRAMPASRQRFKE